MVTEGAGRAVDGRFELLERLGGGGMGLVWRARDTELHREVALKEVRPLDPRIAENGSAEAAVLRERVLREARALARLRHPHVVTIFHIVTGHEPQFPWLVMELVPGGSLADRLERGPLLPAEAARLGRGVLSGLVAAHSAGILHRDVKPANVLIREDGSPVLTDFGIAALGELSTLTTSGALIGSPEYIAPERLRGREGDPASDLWSLGMLLYVAVEGTHPLRRGTVLATLTAVLEESVPPPTRAGAFAPVLTALLDRDPAARPDAARLDRLLAAVEAGTAGDALSDTETGAPEPAPDAPGYADLPTRSATVPRPDAGQPADAEPAPDEPSDAAPEDTGATAPPAGRRLRRVVLAFVQVAVVLALIGAGVRFLPGLVEKAGTATGAAPPEHRSDGYFLTPKGMREAVAALKTKTGGTVVQEVTAHGYLVSVSAQRKDRPEVRVSYDYRGDKVEGGTPAGTVGAPDALDMAAFDWDLLDDLWPRARTELGIKNAEPSHLILTYDPGIKGPAIALYVSDEYGASYLMADGRGRIVSRHPREAPAKG
ncbi:protein kinase domain-containing protein [Streptomyces sp. NBC_01012]|uniref:serine/threonine-protein kinase n=1 Tax=Streptomyces sp. NBC_01012 TaxID=2903717 RepID=UPI00386AD05C|nr:protein kinase [Streptomyces sp. NBC_01012]